MTKAVRKAEDFHISVFSLRCDSITMGFQSCPFSCYSKWDPGVRSIKHHMVAVTNEDSACSLDLLHRNLHFNQISGYSHVY